VIFQRGQVPVQIQFAAARRVGDLHVGSDADVRRDRGGYVVDHCAYRRRERPQNSTAENPAAQAAARRRSRGSSVNISERLTRQGSE
jgi:hypothetical protein